MRVRIAGEVGGLAERLAPAGGDLPARDRDRAVGMDPAGVPPALGRLAPARRVDLAARDVDVTPGEDAEAAAGIADAALRGDRPARDADATSGGDAAAVLGEAARGLQRPLAGYRQVAPAEQAGGLRIAACRAAGDIAPCVELVAAGQDDVQVDPGVHGRAHVAVDAGHVSGGVVQGDREGPPVHVQGGRAVPARYLELLAGELLPIHVHVVHLYDVRF